MRTAPARGFTYIELIVTLAIVAVLASVAAPVAHIVAQREREVALREALRDIRGGIDAYKHAAEQGRIALKPEQTGYPPRLEDLVDGTVDQSRPDGARLYFLRAIPRDPMCNDATKANAETWAARAYASPPDAPAPGDDVYDVHSASTQVGLDGIPYSRW